ncbi:nucleotide sugar dehydrogenase [Mycobacterium rhizamassiliense]|nr:nucleotide sugar dehydrogenase [Mycobacterium rhizamassiliense]
MPTTPPPEALRVNVIGLGYVGAEVCLAAAAAGHRVAAIENDAVRLGELRADTHKADNWTKIRRAIADRQVDVCDTIEAAPPADVWIVAVATPLDADRHPDTSHIEAAARALARVVTPHAVVILESTSYPGTTERIFLPPFLQQGWTPGVDLFVGYSPERIDPGNREWTMQTIPKLVSGCTEKCAKTIADFYRTVVDSVHPMSSTAAAEMAKLLENSWRLINITFANENETLCTALGLDAWEIGEACRTKPFGYHGLNPGPGAGGHCIPVDAAYLSHFARSVDVSTPVLDTAVQANTERPAVIARRVRDVLADTAAADRPARVLVVGVAYKSDIGDTRESAGIALMRVLHQAGTEVEYHDPHVPTLRLPHGGFRSVPLTAGTAEEYDCIVVTTAHAAVDWEVLKYCTTALIDTCNAAALIARLA